MRASPLGVLIIFIVCPAPARADDSLMSLEVRLSGGLTLAESSSFTVKLAPVGVGVGGEVAVIAEPSTSVYGHLELDTVASVGFGADLGVRVRPQEGRLRFGIGVTGRFAPAAEGGVEAAFGACSKPTQTHFCVDIMGKVMLVGEELPLGQLDAQIGVAVELGLDVL